MGQAIKAAILSRVLVCSGALCIASAPLAAYAQNIPAIPATGSDLQSFLSPQPTAGAANLEPPSADYTGVHAGPWTVFPSVFTGLAYNDNIYQTTNNRVGDVAWRTTPTIIAVNNSGINKLSLYALADSYLYLRHSDENTINARVGLEDVWEIQRDLVFRVSGDVSRQTDTMDSGQIVGATTVLPLHYWQYEAGASLIKSFNQFFVGVGGTFVNQTYDNAAQTQGSSLPEFYRDLDVYTVTGRVGYFLGPEIYSYVETSGNQQTYYNDGLFSSRGYRAVGGLGADPFSLFKGEVYGGYQEQYYNSSLGGAQGGTVFGGKISWLPLAYLTVSADLGEAFSTSVASSLTPTTASATKTTTADLTVEYALAQTWSASARAGFADLIYIGSSRVDNDWSAGLTLRRRIWENLSATADLQLLRVNSNYPNASYTENVVSLGLTYLP